MHNPYESPVADGVAPADRVVDQRSRLRVLTIAFRVWMVSKIMVAAVDVVDGMRLMPIDEWSDDDPRLLWVGMLGVVHVLAFAAFAVGLFVVLVRAHRNAREIKGLPLFHSVFALVAWFFVPIGQLFVPFEKVREVWLASTPPGRPPTPPPPSFDAWWAGWVIGCIGLAIMGKAGNAIAYSQPFFALVTTAALVWAGSSAVETLRRLDALQRERHSQ